MEQGIFSRVEKLQASSRGRFALSTEKKKMLNKVQKAVERMEHPSRNIAAWSAKVKSKKQRARVHIRMCIKQYFVLCIPKTVRF